MTIPTLRIAKNFFKLGEKRLVNLDKKAPGLLDKMEKAVGKLSDGVLNKVAHAPSGGEYAIRDQIQLSTTGRRGGEFFKVQGPEIASDLSSLKPINVRTTTRGTQSGEDFVQEKLNLIAKFKNALQNERSEHVNVKFATEGGGLRHRKITDQTVDRYKDAVAAFKSPANTKELKAFKNEANKVETNILKQGQFRIRQTIPAVQNAEGNITSPAKKFTVNLVQGKQNTTDYVNNGIQVAKRLQERPETIGKKFTVANTTTQTLRGRAPSAQKIKQYDTALKYFKRNEETIKDMVDAFPEYAEGQFSRRLTGKNQYVVERTAEGPKERYAITPHKETLPQFIENANGFAKRTAFSSHLLDSNTGTLAGVSISPKFMLSNGHIKEDGLQAFDKVHRIFQSKIAGSGEVGSKFSPLSDGLALRLKGNEKFSIKDVAPEVADAEEGAATQAARSLKNLKLRQGNQGFNDFIENGIEFASLKKQHNQYMSESFGVKGNWLTGNRVKAKGLALRNEAIQFFNANAAKLQELQQEGLIFKLRKHGKIALQYGENTSWLDAPGKSLSQQNGEDLTGFLTRGLKEAEAFVGKRKNTPPKALFGFNTLKHDLHEGIQQEIQKNESRVPHGYELRGHEGSVQIIHKASGKVHVTHQPQMGQSIGELVEQAVSATQRYAEAVPPAPKKSIGFGFLGKKASSVAEEASETSKKAGFWKRHFGKKKAEPVESSAPPSRPPSRPTSPNPDDALPNLNPVQETPVNTPPVSPVQQVRFAPPPVPRKERELFERSSLTQTGVEAAKRDGALIGAVPQPALTFINPDLTYHQSVKKVVASDSADSVATPIVPPRSTDESRRRFKEKQQASASTTALKSPLLPPKSPRRKSTEKQQAPASSNEVKGSAVGPVSPLLSANVTPSISRFSSLNSVDRPFRSYSVPDLQSYENGLGADIFN